MKKYFLALLVAFGFAGAAAAAEKGPYEVVASTTQELMSVIEEARGYADEDPDRFNREVEALLDRVVDFQSFARGVMGKYGSGSYYKSLSSDEERAKFRSQVIRFTETFKSGLINTYSKGLLTFNGNRIEVLPLDDDADLSGSVGVTQKIYGDRPEPYQVYYTMRKDRDGTWKVRNVIIEGLNVGELYQNQFAADARSYKGDIDKVIDNWSVVPQEAMEEKVAK
ncbi:ABC-type transport system involved in resistance to organic solvents, auxiliary component [Spongiibacter sp. IMCC21906]|uniref:MlaC/ttg2D family ABC transporter substrate-binding protein n=1 Tax=Spongiibacter sp. IMCC21906 TaxID=1620392 RepID=UPI00062E023E|nr:ABC transporter substrate-binding protein [Spongiibacter sp. IMCC21906]AKH68865.1 ABC-type transport system involved in resistance to organic solvents, auxiliary component [Spongiibacter sp. IMCC21906]